MKKIITILCVCSLLSSISTTVFAENVVTNSEKITDTKEIYDIVAPFIKENYADDARIIYEKDGSVYIDILSVPIGVTEDHQKHVADGISRYIEEKNIDSSMVYVIFADNAAVVEKITDPKEIYDIVAPFIKENYADDAWISYEEDGNERERAVYIVINKVPIGVTEEYQKQIADSIFRYIEEKNIDSSMVSILVLDDVAVSNKIGDIDGNQTVDLSDLTKLSQYLLRDIELEDDQINWSDVNADDEVNLQDLALLKQFVMNDDVQLGLSS